MHLRPATPILILFACASLLVSCAGAATDPGAPAPAGGMMGGSGGDMASGAIAAAGDANITVGAGTVTRQGIAIERVLAPSDGWLVVRSASEPGAVLGKMAVKAGETRDVILPFTTLDGPAVRVALHVDRGVRGDLGFYPGLPERTTDKPVYAGGVPIEATIEVPGYGVVAAPNSVLIMASDQKVAATGLKVDYLLVPGPSWICVNVLADGLPGRRVGLVSRQAGESQGIFVPLGGGSALGELLITVHADGGRLGDFEYDPLDPLGSPDRPYLSAGVQVSQRILAE